MCSLLLLKSIPSSWSRVIAVPLLSSWDHELWAQNLPGSKWERSTSFGDSPSSCKMEQMETMRRNYSPPRTQHIPTQMSAVNSCVAPSWRRKTVRSCLCFEEILKPEHNQQHLHFRLCFDAKNVHPSIWLVTKPFWELHRQKKEQRSMGSIKSKWWEKSSQLWY